MKRIIALLTALTLLSPFFSQTTINAAFYDDNPFVYYDNSRRDFLNGKKTKLSASYSAPAAENSGDYIVKFRKEVSLQTIYDILILYPFKPLAYSGERIFKVTLSPATGFADKYRDLFEFFEPDSQSSFLESQEAEDFDLWHLDMINAPVAWEISKGEGSVVAVIDTGIDRNHSAFANTKILNGFNILTGIEGNTEDKTGHGTNVAGLIAASPLGAAPKATILPIKISDTLTNAKISDIVYAIMLAADLSADVINMSFGSDKKSESEAAAILYAAEKGCILVAAAGNDGTDTLKYPAAYDGVIAVGSVNSNGNLAGHSQRNISVDVAAPGSNLLVVNYSDNPYDHNKISIKSGTSYAAALVSAAAAILVSANGSYNTYEFEKLIEYTAKTSKDTYVGWGILDISALFEAAKYPIIQGVNNNGVYFEGINPTFKKGTALLNGEPYKSGNRIFSQGNHTLAVTHNGLTREINFFIDTVKLTYNLIKTVDDFSFTFTRGTATLDDLPYASGTKINKSGEYNFVLTGMYGNTVSETVKFIKELPIVYGVENGRKYTNPVAIRVVGEGYSYLNDKPFSEDTVIYMDGTYTLTVENLNKTKKTSITFEINTSISFINVNMKGMSNLLIDEKYGYAALNSESGVAIYIKNLNNMNDNTRVLLVNGKIIGLFFKDEDMIAVTENGYSINGRASLLKLTGATPAYYSFGGTALKSIILDDKIYYLLKNGDFYVTTIGSNINHKITNISGSPLSFAVNAEEKSFYFAAENTITTYSVKTNTSKKTLIGIYNTPETMEYSNNILIAGRYSYNINNLSAVKYTANYNGLIQFINESVFIADNTVFDLQSGIPIGTLGIKIINVCEAESAFYYLDNNDKIIKSLKNTAISAEKPEHYGFASIVSKLLGNSYSSDYKYIGNYHSSLNLKKLFYDRQRNLIYAIAENDRCLYVLDDSSLVLQSTAVLNYYPNDIFTDNDNNVWISFDSVDFVYKNGKYIQIPYVPDKIFGYGNEIYYLSNFCLYAYNINSKTNILLSDDKMIENFTVWEGSLYIYSFFSLERYDLAKKELICFKSITFKGTMLVSRGILIAGQYLLDPLNLDVIANTGYNILSFHNNAVITSKGLYSIKDNAHIKDKFFDYEQGVIIYNYNSIFLQGNKLTMLFSGGKDITQTAVINNLAENGIYYDSVTIAFDKGIASLNGIQINSGHKITQAGKYTLVIINPWNIRQQLTFTVKQKPTAIKLNTINIKLDIGDIYRIRADLQPAGAEGTITFVSDNPDCVGVDSLGNITAVSYGTAIITASFEKLSAICTVSVTADLITTIPKSGYVVDRSTGTIYINTNIVAYAKNIFYTYMNQPGEYILRNTDGKSVTDGESLLTTGMVLEKWDNDAVIDMLTVVIKGDLNGDGLITFEDADEIVKIIQSGTYDEISSYIFSAADYNNSGRINEDDLSLVLNYIHKNDLYATENITALDYVNPYIGYQNNNIWLDIVIAEDSGFKAISGLLVFDSKHLDFLYLSSGYDIWQTNLKNDGELRYSVLNLSEIKGNITLRFYFKLKIGNDKVSIKHTSDILKNSGLSGSKPITAVINAKTNPTEKLNLSIPEAEDFIFDENVNYYNIYAVTKNQFIIFDFDCPAECYIVFKNQGVFLEDPVDIKFIYISGETQKNYVIRVTRTEEGAKNNDSSLKFLFLQEYGEIAQNENGIFYAQVPRDFSWVVFDAEANDPNAVVVLPQEASVLTGENIFVVSCAAEDGTVTDYKIIIYREEPAEESSEIPAESSQPVLESTEESSQIPEISPSHSSENEKTNSPFVLTIAVVLAILTVAIAAVVFIRRKKNLARDFFNK